MDPWLKDLKCSYVWLSNYVLSCSVNQSANRSPRVRKQTEQGVGEGGNGYAVCVRIEKSVGAVCIYRESLCLFCCVCVGGLSEQL